MGKLLGRAIRCTNEIRELERSFEIVVGEAGRREFGGLGFSFWGHICSRKDSYFLSQRNTHNIPAGNTKQS